MRLGPILLAAIMLISCMGDLPQGGIQIVTFNTQTLFDDVEDGDEFSPFTRAEGWNSTHYAQRLERLREAVRSSLDADIIFLQEVESDRVLDDLLDQSLRRRGYRYYCTADDSSPISVGFISKHKPLSVTVHGIEEERPILRAEFLIDGNQLTVYCLHAKSNLGDEDGNRAARKDLASLLNSLVVDDAGPVVILGDFNSMPRADTLDMLAVVGALDSSSIMAASSLPVSHRREGLDGITFYDPMLDPLVPLGADGTYWYQGRWYDYDRVLLDDDALRAHPDFSVEIITWNNDNGFPEAYEGEGRWDGFSDHFPLRLCLR